MKGRTIIRLAAGLLYTTTHVLAFPESFALLPRGQCVSCSRGKSPTPSRPPASERESGRGQTHGANPTQPGVPSQRERVSQSPPQQARRPASQPGVASSRTGQGSSSSGRGPSTPSGGRTSKVRFRVVQDSNIGPKKVDPSMTWETKRPPVEATVKMGGPGRLNYRYGKPSISGYPYGGEIVKEHKGPGPAEFKFSDPHKMEVMATSKGNDVQLTGTGGKAGVGYFYAHGQGVATAESKRDGKKEMTLEPEPKGSHSSDPSSSVQRVRVKAHPDETASASSQLHGSGATWIELSNSPHTTPPQSPRVPL